MAPKRQYKCARKMIDGQIVNNVNLTKLLFQSLQMIHHVSLMRKQAEGSPVSTFLHKIAELDRFTRPARPHSDVIKRIQTLNRSWAKQQIGIDKSEGENFKVIPMITTGAPDTTDTAGTCTGNYAIPRLCPWRRTTWLPSREKHYDPVNTAVYERHT